MKEDRKKLTIATEYSLDKAIIHFDRNIRGKNAYLPASGLNCPVVQ